MLRDSRKHPPLSPRLFSELLEMNMLLEKPLCFDTSTQSKSQVFAFYQLDAISLLPRVALSLKPISQWALSTPDTPPAGGRMANISLSTEFIWQKYYTWLRVPEVPLAIPIQYLGQSVLSSEKQPTLDRVPLESASLWFRSAGRGYSS